ncbi:unnamed protein product [Discosporangium mesarthrocarpum]
MCVCVCAEGYCNTDMTSGMGPRPPEVGARTPFMLTQLPDGGPTGLFYRDEMEMEW